MNFSIITNQILVLALLAMIGVVATKLKVISEEIKNSIATIVFNITLPALIITSVSNVELNREILYNSLLVFILSHIGIVLLFFSGKISRSVLKIKGKKGNIHLIHTMLGNVAFLGYPLFSALFPGGEGLLYAVIFHLTQDIYIWTVGVFEFNNSKNITFKESLKHLINPNTVAFVIGILMLAVSFKLPEFINVPATGLGKTTIYLAMLYIGAVLAQNPMITAFKKKEIYALIFNKMLFIPFILLLIINLATYLFDIQIGNVAKTVVVMQTAMPCMAMVVVLAKKFGSDDIHATENLFLSTIISLATLPLIYLIIQIL
ncbi:MAG: AEC family transporter [Bacteroidales bacterium]|jgi:predicted permease|nr:AEC family transporter [Bacteroidales bacterium]